MWSVQTNKGDKQMKTIYKEPRASKPEANEVQAVRKLNSTGSLRRVEGTRYDLIVSYNTPIAYVVDVENGTFFNEIFKFGNWDCPDCGETDIKEIKDGK